MQFLTGYICIIATLMNISLQVVAQAPAGPGAVDAETSDVMAALGGGKPGAGKSTGKGAGGSNAMQTNLVSAIDGFLREPVPQGASGNVFQLVIQYLEKAGGGAGGAAGGSAGKSGRSGVSRGGKRS
ncbi:hypothetical protein PGT21_018801 [Puccinia graminis f. sp. tritici]|uniref:Uncharacterized protein n=2 Tax=Puccinia graminis f. sp. tritici TaxID=56615 RepID=E3KUL8_PUCGT|nr:uncharacterized protein PGTG_13772 [Puccinia graminis f. sp. tritici CRL 75-36-700-3]EFP87968.1 hypothetical protein PGTG_13772 [Puccinia graminis f. sp. tritici CRL 75-36-700-3]KAA1108595.1 hypothetical protein PGT21_018801 [Puccinia graminis f. sp. tritici]KAA1138481.1 hypothetical protein PGTUg99_017377 [Puccinia graminis f. sp. tritici]